MVVQAEVALECKADIMVQLKETSKMMDSRISVAVKDFSIEVVADTEVVVEATTIIEAITTTVMATKTTSKTARTTTTIVVRCNQVTKEITLISSKWVVCKVLQVAKWVRCLHKHSSKWVNNLLRT